MGVDGGEWVGVEVSTLSVYQIITQLIFLASHHLNIASGLE
jgi:hypothetical protein